MSDREHNPEETAGAAKTLAVVAGVVLLMIAVPVEKATASSRSWIRSRSRCEAMRKVASGFCAAWSPLVSGVERCC